MATTHNETDDLITELVKDHDEVRAIFDRLSPTAAGPADERAELVRRMTVELVKHSVAEEAYLYPLIRKVLPDGDRLADHEIEEHAEVERLLKDLEDLEPADPLYDEKLGKVIDDVRHHAREEEDVVFPQLRDECSPDELLELGDKVRTIKKIAPTHPHPSAPDTPPANLIAGPMAGIVDRVRDALARLSD
ncbi:MAG TPA: hemerythrin domain-containing protein [Kribbellaceae bacterium]|jgi:hemerythrin superfamily protein